MDTWANVSPVASTISFFAASFGNWFAWKASSSACFCSGVFCFTDREDSFCPGSVAGACAGEGCRRFPCTDAVVGGGVYDGCCCCGGGGMERCGVGAPVVMTAVGGCVVVGRCGGGGRKLNDPWGPAFYCKRKGEKKK